MKSALVLLGLAAVATAHNLPVPSDEVNAKSIDAEFQAKAQFDGFKTKFNKQYSSKHEESARYGVFRRNLIRIAQLNKLNENGGGSNDVFGVTAFSDLTPKEFAATHLGYKPTAEHRQARKHVPVYDADADVNTNIIPGFGNGTIVDWRTKGAVSAVKDQGQCGSCWAFSATEQLESNWFLAKGTLPVLAPQQIVSCDTVDQGCDGGWPHSAYDYVKKAGGQDTEASYPYTSGKAGVTGKCKVKTNSFAASLTGYTYATTPCHTNSCNKQDETTLSNNVASKGPASVCVNAAAWQSYQKGVMTPKACGGNGYDDLDHCVQLVGFNDEAASPYWIVRNSWNTNWGLEGFIYLEMGHNTCGIANEATFVTI